MQLTSKSFRDGETIPHKHAFNDMGFTGQNLSPHLAWSDVPAGTKSFAIVMHDPDAPTSGGFYHWVVFNIPGDTRELDEGAVVQQATHGHTDYGSNAYGGPAPPPGPAHRYNITLYALDTEKLPLDKAATGALTEFMVSQHTLAKAGITGKFARS